MTPETAPDEDLSPVSSIDQGVDGEDTLILDIDPSEEVVSTTYEITSYGADFDVDGLVRRMDRGDIVVPSFEPSVSGVEVGAFQRGFVWRKPQMSRFIESLLLGLPVPGIFLVRDQDNRLLVLDGQQRLRSLQSFYAGVIDERVFRLSGVQTPFEGATYKDLRAEDRRRLDDSILHATVLRDESGSNSQEAVYSIYERLNTGGTPLQPQEIRIALYSGAFLNGLARLNADPSWRDLYGPKSARFRDHELILRVIALFDWQSHYRKPLKTFLNRYLAANRGVDVASDPRLGDPFIRAAQAISAALGARAFKSDRVLNVALADAMMVGVMRRLARNGSVADSEVKAGHAALMANSEFIRSITSQTSDVTNVHTRLDLAESAFA